MAHTVVHRDQVRYERRLRAARERQSRRRVIALRDHVGYGAAPPHPQWPGDARVAVSIVVNYEEGSEWNPLEGDPRSEASTEARYDVAPGDRELIQESTFEYGSRAGHWRLLRVLEEYGIRATIYACGMALERNLSYAERISSSQFDIVGHGYRWIAPYLLSYEEHVSDVKTGLSSIKQTTGRQVYGWFARPLPTPETRTILAHAGLTYDCTAVNDDLPYYDVIENKRFLVIPYSLDVNDIRFWKGAFSTSAQFSAYLQDCFETLYEEGRTVPRMMSVGLHGRISGRPARVAAVRRFIEYVQSRPGVWVAGRDEIARHWQETFGGADVWNPIPSNEEM